MLLKLVGEVYNKPPALVEVISDSDDDYWVKKTPVV